MRECEGDGSQRKSEAVEKECRTSEGQTDLRDFRCLHIYKGNNFYLGQESASKYTIPGFKESGLEGI